MGGTRFGEWVGDQELDEWKDDEKYMYHGGGSPWEQLDPRPVQFWRSATDAAYTHPGPRHVDRRALHLDDFAATLAADEAYLLWRRQMPTPLPVAENAERHWEDMRIARQRFPTEPISMERKAYLGVGAEWKARLHWQDSPDTGVYRIFDKRYTKPMHHGIMRTLGARHHFGILMQPAFRIGAIHT